MATFNMLPMLGPQHGHYKAQLDRNEPNYQRLQKRLLRRVERTHGRLP